MTRTDLRRGLWLAGLAACVGCQAAAAQTRFVISPTIGVYAPMNDLVNQVINGEDVVLKQDVGLAVGGRLALFLGQRFSISATGSYVPSELQATIDETGFNTDADKTNLWFGSGRVNFWILPPTGIVGLGLNGGVGLAGRGATTLPTPGGEVLTSPSTTDVGAVIGGTLGFNLGGIGLFVSVDDYIYNASVFEAQGVTSQRQNDLQFSFGLGVPLSQGGR